MSLWQADCRADRWLVKTPARIGQDAEQTLSLAIHIELVVWSLLSIFFDIGPPVVAGYSAQFSGIRHILPLLLSTSTFAAFLLRQKWRVNS